MGITASRNHRSVGCWYSRLGREIPRGIPPGDVVLAAAGIPRGISRHPAGSHETSHGNLPRSPILRIFNILAPQCYNALTHCGCRIFPSALPGHVLNRTTLALQQSIVTYCINNTAKLLFLVLGAAVCSASAHFTAVLQLHKGGFAAAGIRSRSGHEMRNVGICRGRTKAAVVLAMGCTKSIFVRKNK